MPRYTRQLAALCDKNARWLARRRFGGVIFLIFTPIAVGLTFLIPLLISLGVGAPFATSLGQPNVPVDYFPKCIECSPQIAFSPSTDPEVVEIAKELAGRLKMQYGQDVVGFPTAELLAIRVAQGKASKTKTPVNVPIRFGAPGNVTKTHAISYEIWTQSIGPSWTYYSTGVATTDPVDTVLDGFSGAQLSIQRAVDEAILTVRQRAAGVLSPSDHANVKLNVTTFRDVGPQYTYSGWFSRTYALVSMDIVLGIVLTVGGLVTFMVAVFVLSEEKSSGLVAAMRMVGVGEGAYWLSWTLVFFLFSCASALLTAVIGIATRDEFFTKTNFGILFAILMLFYLSITTMAYPVVAAFRRSRVSYIIAFIVFLVAVIMAVILPMVNVWFSPESRMDSYYDTNYPGNNVVTSIGVVFSPFQFTKIFCDVSGLVRNHSVLNQTTWQTTVVPGRPFEWGDFVKRRSVEGEFGYFDGSSYQTNYYMYDVPSVSDAMWLMVLGMAIYYVLGWYFAQVTAFGNAGRPLPIYFPCQPSYWVRAWARERDTLVGDTVGREQNQSRERGSIRCWNLSRAFKTVQAVKEVTLEMESGHVFALLGHNAAGKTTLINCLTGAHPPTSGEAFVFGHSVRTEMPAIRELIGVCHQDNVLWSELTAREHVRLYASFKGVPRDTMEAHIDGLLESVRLDNVGDNRTSTFSGGMKRRLCLAISMAGSPPILFLDEPSSGLDPLSRRRMWDAIEAYKHVGDRVIVLTSHDLQEADAIGDQVGIIAHGSLRALGSPLYLKRKFGRGYQVNAVTAEGMVAEVLTEIRRIAPETEILDTTAGTCTLSVPTAASRRMPVVLRFIADDHRVKEWGFSHTTLEEVFLRLVAQSRSINEPLLTETRKCVVCLERVPDDVVVYTQSHNPIELKDVMCAVCAECTPEAEGDIDVDDIPLLAVAPEQKEEEEEEEEEEVEMVPTQPFLIQPELTGGAVKGKRRWVQQTQAIMLSTLQQRWKNKKAVVCELVLILVLVIVAGIIQITGPSSLEKPCAFDTTPYCPAKGGYTWNSKAYACTDAAYADILLNCSVNGVPTGHWNDMNWLQIYYGKYLFPINIMVTEPETFAVRLSPFMERQPFSVWMSNVTDVQPHFTNVTSADAAMSFVVDSQRLVAANDSCTGATMFNTREEAYRFVWEHFPSGALLFKGIPGNDVKYTIVGYNTRSAWSWARVCSPGNIKTPWPWRGSGYFLTSAPSFPVIMANRVNSGALAASLNDTEQDIAMSLRDYPRDNWMAAIAALSQNYVLLTLIFIAPISMSMVFPVVLRLLVMERRGGLVALMKMSGLKSSSYWTAVWVFGMLCQFVAAGLFTIISAVFQLRPVSPRVGITIGIALAGGHGLFGFAVFLSAFLTRERASAVVGYVLTLVCVVGVGIPTVILAVSGTPTSIPLFALLPLLAFPRALSLGFADTTFMLGSDRHEMVNLIVYGLLIGGSVYALIGMWLHAVLRDRPQGVSSHPLFFLRGLWRSRPKSQEEVALVDLGDDVPPTPEDMDSDVVEERRHTLHGAEDDPVQIRHLTKMYGKGSLAVDDLCMSVRHGECFGLLGPNGAGKTTVVHMLSSILESTSGVAIVGGQVVGEGALDVGICPQFDTHWRDLTVREHLSLFARIKGIAPKHIVGAATHAAELCDIAGDAFDMPASTLSGGIKRRLSIALALVGNPKIIFLDEPTTGIDAESRRLIWSLIHSAKRKRSVILTTHMMNEADALCDRIGIMASGVLRCLGSPTHLKNKFGRGFRLSVHVEGNPDAIGGITAFVNGEWPSAQLDRGFNGRFTWVIPAPVDVARLFQTMHKSAARLNVLEWAIAQSSLDEVFYRIATESEGDDSIIERVQFREGGIATSQ